MCGIAGIWAWGTSDPGQKAINRLTDALRHRGPDGRGTWFDPNAQLRLGHRRLAILDVSAAGAQPMASRSGRFVMVYNGEIYNYVELRHELGAKGHRFETGTDTEVLLAAFAEWGPACLPRLNGMWAFAIWDRERHQLFCSRDRFGLKPFFYAETKGAFTFASELKAFAEVDHVPLDVDGAYLLEKRLQLETTEATLFRSIASLEPGHWLLVDANGARRKERWWRTIDHLPAVPARYETQVEEFRSLFFDACQLRLRSDVPIATSLSGGLDSSSVASTVAKIVGDDGTARQANWVFSQGFPGSSLDESGWAKLVAEAIGARLELTTIDIHEVAGQLSESVHSLEDIDFLPLGVWSHYGTMRSRGVVISLDGHGGDELLAGYPGYVIQERQRALARGRMGTWNRLAAISLAMAGQTHYSGRLAAHSMFLRDDLRVVTRLPRKASLRGAFRSLIDATRKTLPGERPTNVGTERLRTLVESRDIELSREVEGLSPLSAALYSSFHHTTQPYILRNFDRLSMAHGVEVRAPLLDWRIATYAFALSDATKVDQGWNKRILRDAMRGVVPERARRRMDKIGFLAPTEQWISRGLLRVVEDRIFDSGFLSWVPFDAESLRASIRDAVRREDAGAVAARWRWIQADMLITGFLDRRRAE